MLEISLALIIVSLILSITAIVLSCITISTVIGFKNSTHTIEWKPLEVNSAKEDDPFAEDVPMENPNKRKPKIPNPFPQEELKDEDPFLDLDDPNLTSNNW